MMYKQDLCVLCAFRSQGINKMFINGGVSHCGRMAARVHGYGDIFASCAFSLPNFLDIYILVVAV